MSMSSEAHCTINNFHTVLSPILQSVNQSVMVSATNVYFSTKLRLYFVQKKSTHLFYSHLRALPAHISQQTAPTELKRQPTLLQTQLVCAFCGATITFLIYFAIFSMLCNTPRFGAKKESETTGITACSLTLYIQINTFYKDII